jgi:hypothetical protein
VSNKKLKELYPLLTKAIYGKRYILPEGYPNQEEMANAVFLEFLGGVSTALGPLYAELQMETPTFCIEKELGELLLDSQLPEEILAGDIKFPWPAFRLILPKGLLYDKVEDTYVRFIDISYIKMNEPIKCPPQIYEELERNASRGIIIKQGSKTINITCPPPQYTFIPKGNGTVGAKFVAWPENNHLYLWTRTFNPDATLGVLFKDRETTSGFEPMSPEEYDFNERINRFVFNVLLLFSAVPAVYEPDRVGRKMRQEGKHIIPALVHPHWLGDVMLTAKRHGRVKDADESKTHKSPHWRRAHWRRQPYGHGFKDRKLVWILPMHIGKAIASQNNSN